MAAIQTSFEWPVGGEPPAGLLEPPAYLLAQDREYAQLYGDDFPAWAEPADDDCLTPSDEEDLGAEVVEWEAQMRQEFESRLTAERLFEALPARSTGFAARALQDSAPGSETARLLADLDPDQLSDFELVEYIAASDRHASWAHARQLHAIAVLAQRESMNPEWPSTARKVTQPSIVGDEIAMRLRCSRRSAQKLVHHARDLFAGHLVDAGRALEAGKLSVRAAAIIHEHLDHVPYEESQQVLNKVLPKANRRSPWQLGKDLVRELTRVAPEEIAARVKAAKSGRRVDRPRPMIDGMAYWGITAPAADLVMADTVLDHHARRLRNDGDERTLDQLRADLLLSSILNPHSCHHASTTGKGKGPEEAKGSGRTEGAGRAEGAAGSGDAGGSRSAEGAERAEGAAESGDAGGSRSTKGAGKATGWCDVAGRGSTEAPGNAARNAQDKRTEKQSGGPPQDEDSPADDFFGALTRLPIRARINVTVPLSALLHLDDEPGDLEGYGPIDAVTARALAKGGRWRRIVTDPVTNTVLNVGRTTYRPPTALADHVRARDKQCARPGCSVPASVSDLDHTEEFHRHDGETSDANLGPLCARDHQIKTDAGHVLRQLRPGVYAWITPTGHTYLIEPGRDAFATHLDAPHVAEPGEPRIWVVHPRRRAEARSAQMCHDLTHPDDGPTQPDGLVLRGRKAIRDSKIIRGGNVNRSGEIVRGGAVIRDDGDPPF